jgi:hypothetical protein
MTAMTSVFRQTAALGHLMNNVPKPAAAMPDKLAEAFTAGVWRGFPIEHQRVSAVDANIFTMAGALADLHIGVAAQETRQIMPHARRGSINAKQGCATRTQLLYPR